MVGFSWGGGQSFRFATNRKDLSAAFVFYGSGPDAEAIPGFRPRCMAFMPGPTAHQCHHPATQEQMKAARKSYETVTYEGAAHGFMRAGAQPDATEPNKKARAEAWVKLKAVREKLA